MTASEPSTFLSGSVMGSAAFAIRSYSSMARTHLHRPVAALETFSTTAG
eukprot:CAMPEP_0173104270 /NCGR_PEP_ID=MMETSP1102-20130122/39100_1 /TAXON_ID=49646 /ORGANISM="Geminigera sp., Strain Caron Lab Isolate" /LENGTH=48 /DNA_ID= /DNA_START= /DNA_END= /DNA_ORIENTATION=